MQQNEATAGGLGEFLPSVGSLPSGLERLDLSSECDSSEWAFTFFPQEFEDLDEIVARYVQPMASFARDLLNHKYYQDCSGGDRKVSPGPCEG